MDVADGLRIGAGGDGVLGVVHKVELADFQLGDGIKEGVDGAVAFAGEFNFAALVAEDAGEANLRGFTVGAGFGKGMAEQTIGLIHLQIVLVEQLENLAGQQLGAQTIGFLLNDGAELGMHGLGQGIAEVVLHDEGSAALTGLGVDADDGLILAAHIGGINGQIGNLPHIGAGFLHVLNALVDGVLVAAGEGGEHQLAHIGLTGIHFHMGAALVDVLDLVDVGEVQLGVNALGVHVHGQRDHIHVAGAFAVAEQGGLHTFCTGQQTQLCGGNTFAAVIVRMQGDDGAVAGGEITDEILNAVGKIVGHHVFHGGGEVQDDLILRGGVEMLQNSLADFHGVVHLGAHEGLGGILIAEIHAGGNDGLRQLIDQIGGIGGNLGDTGLIHLKDHLPLEGGGGVIEVENDVFCALNGLEGLLNQMRTGLHQHLNGHIVGNMAALDELTADFILGVGGGGEANFNFLHADVHQGVEHLQLLLQIHGVDQRLVAVAQVNGAPYRGLLDLLVGPGAVRKGDGLIGNVFLTARFEIHNIIPPILWRAAQARRAHNGYK